LGVKHQARTVPVQKLDPIGSLRPEDIDDTGVGIGRQLLLHRARQPVHATAEVHRPGRHQHFHARRRTRAGDHRPAFRAWITAATVLVSAPRPMRTVTPSISTSIPPWAPRLRRFFGVATVAAAASMTTGTN